MSDINEMRVHLFDVLRGLKNKSIDIATAKAMNETAQVLINSAKVEADFFKATNGKAGNFITALALPPESAHPALPPGHTGHGVKQITEVPGGSITTHTMR